MPGPKQSLSVPPEILTKLSPSLQDKIKKGEKIDPITNNIIEKLKKGEKLDAQEQVAVGYTEAPVAKAATAVPQTPPNANSDAAKELKGKIETANSNIAAKKEELKNLKQSISKQTPPNPDDVFKANKLQKEIDKQIEESNRLQTQYETTYGVSPNTGQPSNPPTAVPNGNQPPANSPTTVDAGSLAKYTEQQKKEQEEREKKLKEQLGGDDAAGKLRLGYQAALMLTMDKIIKKTGRNGFVNYSNFAFTRFDDTGCNSLSNSLFKSPDMAFFFKKIPPNFLSMLMPSIKLYKVFYPPIESADSPSLFNPSSKGYSWRIPFDDIPVNYDISTSTLQPKIDSILKGYDRMKGCGIKSFSYAYKGTTPAESNSHIEAQLELYFQDINILLTQININDNDLRFEESEKPNLSGKSFYYSDLINGASRFVRVNGKLIPSDQYFRLKAVVGYADLAPQYYIDLKAQGILPDEYIQAFRRAVLSTKITLFLSPVTHDLQFNEDGSVVLKINYQASIDSSLSDPLADIFKISDQDGELIKAKTDYESIRQTRDAEISKIKCNNATDSQEQQKRVNDEANARLKDQEAKLNTLKSQVQADIFKRFIGLKEVGGRKISVYVAEILNTAVGVNTEGKPIAGAPELRLRNAQNLRSENAVGKIETITIEESDLESATPNPPPAEGNSETAGEARTQAETGEKANDDVYIKVKFVFLGDLLDIAFEALKNFQPKKDTPKIIVGELPISIPIEVSSDDPNQIAPQDGVMETNIYNFADIPISLELFNDYYYQYVIKKRLSEYPLHVFLNDIIEKVVKPGISPSVFGKKAVINNTVRISNFGFTLPLTDNGYEPILNKPISDPFNGIITKGITQALKNKFLYQEPILGSAQYLYLYDSMAAPKLVKKNNGDPKLDEESGIFHFYIGTDSGIIKNISFAKMDIPYAAESRAYQEGGKVSNRLRQVYSSTIKLFGNNIYRPGDYIYVDPVVFFKSNNGADASVNLQDKIGLGGYYMITKVETNVSGDNYETTLNCSHQAWKVNDSIGTANDRGGC